MRRPVASSSATSSAWSAATPEQRNKLAALAFQSVEIVDDRAAAVVVDPDYAAFFVIGGHGDTPTARPRYQGHRIDQAEATGIARACRTRPWCPRPTSASARDQRSGTRPRGTRRARWSRGGSE